MSAEILPVTATDVEAIARLARVVWQATYPGIISQEQIDFMLAQRYDSVRLLAELRLDTVYWDKALVDGELAAFSSTVASTLANEWKLDKIYVDPARQRLGMGGLLIARAGEHALRRGGDTLILAVNKRNAHAIAAYRKHGFAVREAVRVDIGNGFLMDDFIMAKSLRTN